MSARDNDIKAPDGYLLGGLRSVRRDGTLLLGRAYWQAPVDWAGERVWVHNRDAYSDFHHIDAAPPGQHIYEAHLKGTALVLASAGRPDAATLHRVLRARKAGPTQ